MDSLVVSNYTAAFAHLVALGGVIALFQATGPPTQFALTRTGIPGPESKSLASGIFEPKCSINFPRDLKPVGTFDVYPAILAFFGITAVAHLFYATDAFGFGWYSKAISEGWNPFRWIEYGLSASIMTMLIGSADGTRDIITLSMLAIVTFALQLQGLSMEAMLKFAAGPGGSLNNEAIMANTISAWILFIGIFIVILYTFATTILDVKNEYDPQQYPDAKVPTWLWFIGPVQLVFYALFGLVQLKQIYDFKRGRAVPYIKYEQAYIMLSFVSKIALASGLAYGLAVRFIGCPKNA